MLGRGHPERHTGGRDLLLGANDPLRDRRFADQEGSGDLRHRQAAHGAQRERDPCLARDRGVTAGEQQRDTVVRLLVGRARAHPLQGLDLPAQRRLPAPAIRRQIPGHRQEPQISTIGDAVLRPPLQRHQRGVLNGVVSGPQVAEGAREPSRRRADRVAQCIGDGLGRHRYRLATGRTSTLPPPGHDLAMAIASSRFGTSITA
jgi:hypothetical protein